METDGGPRGWAFLRRNTVYRDAWRDALKRPEFESAPFEVRVQSSLDRQALEWGLLAWEDPDGTEGPASPFWASAPMLEGEWGRSAPGLPGLLAESGARLGGLRLTDGTLILKIENGEGAAQVRVRAEPGPERGQGLVLRVGFGRESGQAIARLKNLASLAGASVAAPQGGRAGVDRELLRVLDGRLAGKSWRETAMDLYGAKEVAAHWNTDSWMRSRVRRRGKKARVLMEGGYRDLVAGR